MSMSPGFRSVRVHRCAAGPPTNGSWSRVPWSQLTRSVICEPTAATCTAGCLMSAARSLRDTMIATEPSQGTSQS